jgi:hypothetical protein
MQLTFRDIAPLLKANGYAPAPLADNGKPLGPFAVMQVAYSRYATNDDLPAAVLTAVPAPRNEHDPVQDHRCTWLATLAVKVRDELVKEVDAIVAKYIGKAKCPVRVADDGSTLRVFRLAGELFSTVTTDYAHDPHFARVESAAAFVPVNGTWVGGINLLDVMRDELAELDHGRAQQLIGELNALLHAHAPRSEYVLPPPVPRPLLEPGQKLLYGNRRALAALRENGFQPLPVRWGQDDVERDGYSDFMGGWHYNVPLDNHGVGINLSGFALLEFVGVTFRADADEVIRAMGACPIRRVIGDQNPVSVAYLFRCDQSPKNETLYGPVVAHVRRTGLLVLSGEDTYGRAYQWDRDLLTVKANELPALEPHDAQRLQRALEALPSILEYKAAATKGRKRA